jgi:hypothetical protein
VNILLTNATSIFAGGEDYVLILARYLQRRGHTVYVSALPDHLLLEKCRAAGIPVVPVEYRGMDRVFAVSAHLRREMRARAIQIVHSNANYDRTCAALAAMWSPVCHVAGIHSTHSIQHNLTHWMRNRWGIDRFVTAHRRRWHSAGPDCDCADRHRGRTGRPAPGCTGGGTGDAGSG